MKKGITIIAEAGVNHNGKIELAKRLIEKAADSGADYVKFQTFKADKIVTKLADKASYQLKNINNKDNSQYAMLKKLEIPMDWYNKLIEHSNSFGIKFLSTGFDIDSIDFLYKLGMDFFKIPSGEITNKPYLEHVSSKGLPIVLSTGMATMKEIKDALNIFLKNGINKKNITILHCNTEYPTPLKDVNLKAMNFIKKKLDIDVGYSDHTLGIEVSIGAAALGAKVIEKHFTLDKEMEGPDHVASLDPNEFKLMVKGIRNIEKSISGTGIKTPSNSELKNIKVIRKSLHFRNNFLRGYVIKPEDLIALRPGNGISPMKIEFFTGRKLIKNVSRYTLVKNNQFKR